MLRSVVELGRRLSSLDNISLPVLTAEFVYKYVL